MDIRKWNLSRIMADGHRDHVESVPGDGGKDWGYTMDPSKALAVNTYWKRRFLKDMAQVNAERPIAKLVIK